MPSGGSKILKAATRSNPNEHEGKRVTKVAFSLWPLPLRRIEQGNPQASPIEGFDNLLSDKLRLFSPNLFVRMVLEEITDCPGDVVFTRYGSSILLHAEGFVSAHYRKPKNERIAPITTINPIK